MAAPKSIRALPTEATVLSREEAGGSDRTIRFVASTQGVARDGGIVDVQGWDTTAFKAAHPSFLWAHNAQGLPLGKATRVEKGANGLLIDVEFAGEEQKHPFAETVFKLYKAGFLRAVSVGFRVLEERQPTEDEKARGARWVASKAELLELSAVPVPADPGAVVQGHDFTSADIAALKTQTEGIETWTPVIRSIEQALSAPPPPPKPEPPALTLDNVREIVRSEIERLYALLQQTRTAEAPVGAVERKAPVAAPADGELYAGLLDRATRYAGK